jgi:hypothetical protein
MGAGSREFVSFLSVAADWDCPRCGMYFFNDGLRQGLESGLNLQEVSGCGGKSELVVVKTRLFGRFS